MKELKEKLLAYEDKRRETERCMKYYLGESSKKHTRGEQSVNLFENSPMKTAKSNSSKRSSKTERL